MFDTLNFTELVVAFIVLFLLFGAKRLPDIGKNLGEGIRNFKKAVTGEDETSHK
jgi:sec-independent protein translocase protein TatA